MSKYHPLDVRHPSNRNRERNSYLLAPADDSTYELRSLQTTEQAPSRRGDDFRKTDAASSDASTEPTDRPAEPEAKPGNPWGGAAQVVATQGPLSAPKNRKWFPRFILLGIITYVIVQSFDLWDEVTQFITRAIYELGL